jgi:hypothetical protein
MTDGNDNLTGGKPITLTSSLKGGRVPDLGSQCSPKSHDQVHLLQSVEDIRGSNSDGSGKMSRPIAMTSSKPISLADLAKSHNSPKSPFSLNIRQGSPTTKFAFGTPPRSEATGRSPTPSLAALAHMHQATSSPPRVPTSPAPSSSSSSSSSSHHASSRLPPTAQFSALSTASSLSSNATHSASTLSTSQSSNPPVLHPASQIIASAKGPSLAELATKHRTPDSSIIESNKPPTSGFSLAALASMHQQSSKVDCSVKATVPKQAPKVVKGFSLADLAQVHKEKTTAIASPPNMSGISLSELAAHHGKKDAKTVSIPPGFKPLAGKDSSIACVSKPSNQHDLVSTRPSAFASALSSCYRKKSVHSQPAEMHPQFCYSNQVKPLADCSLSTPAFAIQPFDFSSPSPDDYVKDKQKGAFLRTGEGVVKFGV